MSAERRKQNICSKSNTEGLKENCYLTFNRELFMSSTDLHEVVVFIGRCHVSVFMRDDNGRFQKHIGKSLPSLLD